MSGSDDSGPLSALVAYEQEVVFGYDQALAKAPLTTSDRLTLRGFRADAQTAAAALRRALEQIGGTSPARPDPRLAPPPADPSRRGWMRAVVTAEENSVQAYYTALQQLSGDRHLAGSAAFMAAAGRRLVVLRDRAGEPLLPRAFETGA
jgi:hypothetical protein